MPGHISEKTWDTVSDETHRKMNKLVQFIVEGEALYQELLRLWLYHSNDDQAVADQLFGSVDEGGAAVPATAEQLAKVVDLKNSLIAAHSIHEDAACMNALRMLS